MICHDSLFSACSILHDLVLYKYYVENKVLIGVILVSYLQSKSETGTINTKIFKKFFFVITQLLVACTLHE